jgi:hypothetical protein
MKESPQLMGVIAASAAVGGLALSRALTAGGTVAWCVATSCATITLFALVAAVQYLRWARSSERRTAAEVYFDNWPEELDVLVANASEEQRALAAANIGAKAGVSTWAYRDDAIRILEYVVSQPESPAKLKASAIGALICLKPESCPPAVIGLASDPKGPLNLIQACWTCLARSPGNRSILDKIIRGTLPGNPRLEGCATAALLYAFGKAKSVEQRADILKWMDALVTESGVFRQAAANFQSLRAIERGSESSGCGLENAKLNEEVTPRTDEPLLIQSLRRS